MICGYCGHQFEESEGVQGCGGCGGGCHAVHCPKCGYKNPKEAALFKKLKGIISKKGENA